jgi:hypothetical protein
MVSRARSLGGSRLFLWISMLVLVAGVIAFVTVSLGSGGGATTQSNSPPPPNIDGTDYVPGGVQKPRNVNEVPKAARVAAGEFILAAVGREDLPKAWRLSHPDLKKACACSYKQWLSGNIPVQPFPTGGLQGVAYAVNELSPRRVVLETLLSPKPGGGAHESAFYLGLKAVGTGSQLKWLVDYWAPMGVPPVPLNP